jgi:hypothetical protein
LPSQSTEELNTPEAPRKRGRPRKEPKKPKVIWSPQPKQTLALVRHEFEILYGGARGGGKTDAGMAWLLYNIQNPRFRGLVIRLNAKDLNDWVDRAQKMYAGTGAVFKGQPTEIHFPSGAVIRTGHLKDENAYTQYQGHEYQNILIEELTQIPTETSYEQLISSCRSTCDIPPQVFCTTNPGNVGHTWVKLRWNIHLNAQGGYDEVIQIIPEGRKVGERGTRAFIHATVDDNAVLNEKDPSYVAGLDALSDENLRKAWRFGSWDNPIIEGAIYKSEIDAAWAAGRITEVKHDPRHPVHTYWDLGIADQTAIGFFQKVGNAWYMIDYYEDAGKGLGHYIQYIQAKPYFYGSHFAPHDIDQREWTSGQSRRLTAEQLGLYFTIVPKISIEDGIDAVRMKFSLLYLDKTKCAKFIDAISAYRYEFDEKLQQYKNKPLHDWSSHAADMLRYWAVAYDPVLPGQMTEDYNLYTQSFA